MFRLILLLLVTGCALHSPRNIVKNNKKEARNWLEIYNSEIKIAIENEDTEAFYFFLQEYVKEKRRLEKN